MEAALHLFQLVPYPRWRRLGSRNEWNEFHLDTGENIALSKMLGIWLLYDENTFHFDVQFLICF